MSSSQKGSRLDSVQKWKKKLLKAIRLKSTEGVATALDRLNRIGVHEGFEIDQGKEYLQTAS